MTQWIEQLAARGVPTPAYVYGVEAAAANFCALREALGTPVLLCLSACANPDVLSRLPEDCRFGARVASRWEMMMVAAWKSALSYFAMPALDANAVRAALGSRLRILIESPWQLDMLLAQRGQRQVAPIILGINPGLTQRDTTVVPMSADRGLDADGIAQVLELALRSDLRVGGVHCFAGTGNFHRDALDVARTMRAWLGRIEETLGYPLETVNLGGALPADWVDRTFDMAAYRTAIAQFPPHVQVIHEAGRAIFASAGVFATRVLAVGETLGRRHARCDGGLAQALLLTQAAGTRRVPASPYVFREGCLVPPGGNSVTEVLGASGHQGDTFGSVDVALRAGDLLLFPGAGAYCETHAASHLLGESGVPSYVV
ncbi:MULTISPECIES: hypothetical protein [unclassified Paraburkholderia]|uniref:hypothetical protein n=1 Tax=unclassified Paraburkholderia TaxID=2615204 RepID=UPI002AB25409|nr:MULTISPECIES: hypothetical protein [unclassified Paraburkholderia]